MARRPMLTTFRIGDAAVRGEALRLGVVRRPPRGVPRHRWVTDGHFDVWFPAIAPSAALLRRFRPSSLGDPAVFARFAAAYARELGGTEARQTLALIAALAARTPIALGCYCEDESRCHRGVLRQAVLSQGSRRLDPV